MLPPMHPKWFSLPLLHTVWIHLWWLFLLIIPFGGSTICSMNSFTDLAWIISTWKPHLPPYLLWHRDNIEIDERLNLLLFYKGGNNGHFGFQCVQPSLARRAAATLDKIILHQKLHTTNPFNYWLKIYKQHPNNKNIEILYWFPTCHDFIVDK